MRKNKIEVIYCKINKEAYTSAFRKTPDKRQ